MPNNVIDVCYSESRRSKTRHAFQYDYGQKLAFSGFDLPDAFEVHFATDTGSITQIGTGNQVTIPDACFTAAKSVYAWLYLHEGESDGETRYEIEIPVRPRAAITREEPTPVQQDAIDQAITALQSAVEKTGEAQQAAEDAAESVKNAGATAETLEPGSPATVVVEDVDGVKTFRFGIPEGHQGQTGETPNFTVGSVTTLPAGSPVTVTITGTAENPILNLGIPKGAPGSKGDTGAVPHFTIGTVTTLPPDSPATVTITGTDENPILNLGIPKGVQGQKGDKGDAFTYADFTEAQKLELIQGPIKTAQDAAVESVEDAGAEQVQAVEDKGAEVRGSIPSDYTSLSEDVSNLKSAITLLDEMIMDTVQAISFDQSGNVSQITHSKNGAVVRTDVFTFGTGTITEVRTLAATGESVTIVTNTTTLATTVTYAAA